MDANIIFLVIFGFVLSSVYAFLGFSVVKYYDRDIISERVSHMFPMFSLATYFGFSAADYSQKYFLKGDLFLSVLVVIALTVLLLVISFILGYVTTRAVFRNGQVSFERGGISFFKKDCSDIKSVYLLPVYKFDGKVKYYQLMTRTSDFETHVIIKRLHLYNYLCIERINEKIEERIVY